MPDQLYNSEQERAALANALLNGLQGEFWAALKKIIQFNVTTGTARLINDDSADEKGREHLRQDIRRNQKLLDMPEHFIKELTKKDPEPPDLDPY